MNYYVLKVEKFNDETADKKAIYTFDTKTEAIANFHSYLGASMKTENLSQCMYIVIDDNGDDYKREAYTAPVVEEEEEETSEEEETTSDEE